MLKPKTSIFFIFILFTSVCAYSQNISGIYRWDLDSGRRTFTVYLEAEDSIANVAPTSFKGEHCGVFEDGQRMDCSYEEYSITLNKVAENIFTGTILSAYSRTIHDIKVTFLPANQQIRWEVTNHRGGTTYFPLDVVMNK